MYVNDRVLILISFIGDEDRIDENLHDKQMMYFRSNYALYCDVKTELLVIRTNSRWNLR